MTTAELLAELREVLADELPAYGFRDVTVLGYLNEAQEKFCEDTGFFADTTTFTAQTVDGVAAYALDSRIIRVTDVFVGGRQLCKLDGHRPPQTALEPATWQTSKASGFLSVWPTPTTVVTLNIHAWRYPLADMTVNVVGSTPAVNPEINKRMHRALIEWAAFKCYGHHDIELEGSSEAARHKANYRQYVLEGRVLKRNLDAEQIVVGVNSCYQVV